MRAPTSQVRVRFRAQDQTPGDYVEAGVDDVRVFAATCPPENPADLDGNGVVNGADLGLLLNAWGTPQYDLAGDGTVSGADVGFLLGYWG